MNICLFIVILTFFDWLSHYCSHKYKHSHSYIHHKIDSTNNYYTYDDTSFIPYLYNYFKFDSAVHLNALFVVLLILLLKPQRILIYVFLLHALFISIMHYIYHVKPAWEITKHHQKHHRQNSSNFSVSPFGFIFDMLFSTKSY